MPYGQPTKPNQFGDNIQYNIQHSTPNINHTLVLPPQKKMYLLGKQDKKQKAHFGFEDFFPMQQMATENAAIDMITMKEFLKTEALTGKLKKKETGEVSYPPGNRTEWNGCSPDEWDQLREWLRTVSVKVHS